MKYDKNLLETWLRRLKEYVAISLLVAIIVIPSSAMVIWVGIRDADSSIGVRVMTAIFGLIGIAVGLVAACLSISLAKVRRMLFRGQDMHFSKLVAAPRARTPFWGLLTQRLGEPMCECDQGLLVYLGIMEETAGDGL
jgi:hypothetical protein